MSESARFNMVEAQIRPSDVTDNRILAAAVEVENGIITDPITLPPDETVGTARRIMEQHRISGVPITVKGYLKGILTRRDLRFPRTTSNGCPR